MLQAVMTEAGSLAAPCLCQCVRDKNYVGVLSGTVRQPARHYCYLTKKNDIVVC